MYDWLCFSGEQQEQNIGIIGYEVYSKISVFKQPIRSAMITASIGRARDGANDIHPES